jgi:hypothetical protein
VAQQPVQFAQPVAGTPVTINGCTCTCPQPVAYPH